MEFNEKLQQLRKQRGLTQEELSKMLYVSRTAISKWESGRGYPNIESLKQIAKIFSVSVDQLLSTDDALALATEEGKRRVGSVRDLIFGLLDIFSVFLVFLPLFADRSEGGAVAVSLLAVNLSPYLLALYYIFIAMMIVIGVLTLVFQNCEIGFWVRSKGYISLCLGGALTLFFIISLQPYAATFAFLLLAVKTIMILKVSRL